MKPDRKKHANLAKAWDEYGHLIGFDDLIDAKWRSDGGYVVVAWSEDGGWIGTADLYCLQDGTVDFCNDNCGTFSKKQWRSLKIDRYCDNFTVPDEL